MSDRGYRDRAESTSNFSSLCYTVPEGVQLFKANMEKAQLIDILGYITGEGNFKPPGQLHPERTYFAHQGIGVNTEKVICLAKTWKERCPICEDVSVMKRNPRADTALIKSLAPKQRQLWWVFDHGEPEKGFQLWDFSEWNFGKLLSARINKAHDSLGWHLFYYPTAAQGGKTLRVEFSPNTIEGSKPFPQASAIDFQPRVFDYSPEHVRGLPCLDNLITHPSYEEIQELYLQGTPGGEDSYQSKDAGYTGTAPPPVFQGAHTPPAATGPMPWETAAPQNPAVFAPTAARPAPPQAPPPAPGGYAFAPNIGTPPAPPPAPGGFTPPVTSTNDGWADQPPNPTRPAPPPAPGGYAPPQAPPPAPGGYAPPQAPPPAPGGYAPPQAPPPAPGGYAPPQAPPPAAAHQPPKRESDEWSTGPTAAPAYPPPQGAPGGWQ